MNWELLNSLAELCALKGVQHAVICPGSRSAPITLAFTRNKKIKCWTFSDERSAAFIALGMSRQTRTPVVVICTSGSAGYNFAPAVAEAFFQQVPLIVFTADRPPEWIDQYDGQTIRQHGIFRDHVKRFYELPLDLTHADAAWHGNRIVNEAVNLSGCFPEGPVHINTPFREPLYPEEKSTYIAPPAPRVISRLPGEHGLIQQSWDRIAKEVAGFKKVLVVSGQQSVDESLLHALSDFQSTNFWPVAGDLLSNLHSLPSFARHPDTYLGQMPPGKREELRPDLLITFGKSLIAKNLKLFLRQFAPREHWHLQPAGEVADTFKSLTRIIPVGPGAFFRQLRNLDHTNLQGWKDYQSLWSKQESIAHEAIGRYFNSQQGEFQWVSRLMEALPPRCNLHVANSMSVRYANHIGLKPSQKGVVVFANRGTSGIDGCSSTTVGHTLTSEVPNVLITGDVAFFYDRNAFWSNYPLSNLYVVVLNNHGGIIFNLIDGPSGLPESEEFFITRQHLNARSLAKEFGFEYLDANSDPATFFAPTGKAKILEIESSQGASKKVFENFRNQIKKTYEA